ncbi:hypothetical protein RCH09_003620 [Actimicrobium sp. GrIS 1.19]|uniref:hypothetical protein n=1 Tax=Actimicrobium sp. GrIS 1.19 TaxID=3071708 RepID=UPI002E0778EB|nr:hypothetical protein [Actimicrobium sp. GrIS 1.19]
MPYKTSVWIEVIVPQVFVAIGTRRRGWPGNFPSCCCVDHVPITVVVLVGEMITANCIRPGCPPGALGTNKLSGSGHRGSGGERRRNAGVSPLVDVSRLDAEVVESAVIDRRMVSTKAAPARPFVAAFRDRSRRLSGTLAKTLLF